MKERIFQDLIQEVCIEMGIEFEKLHYGKILLMTKDGKTKYIMDNRFDLNGEAAGKAASNKYATYEVLKSQNVPVIEHMLIFNPARLAAKNISDSGIWPTIITEFNKQGCLVVKANSGAEGRSVYLCSTQKETEIAIEKLFKKCESLSICPYYDIRTEYRTLYLDGKVFLIYGKTKPFVVGDGVSTLDQLIDKINLPNSSIVNDNLKNLDLTMVPEKGMKVNVSWKHNLTGGATPKILEKGELYTRIEQLALKAGKAMNINFASIDIIETNDDDLYVLEINSGIGTAVFMEKIEGGHEIIKGIYKEVLTKLFQ